MKFAHKKILSPSFRSNHQYEIIRIVSFSGLMLPDVTVDANIVSLLCGTVMRNSSFIRTIIRFVSSFSKFAPPVKELKIGFLLKKKSKEFEKVLVIYIFHYFKSIYHNIILTRSFLLLVSLLSPIKT